MKRYSFTLLLQRDPEMDGVWSPGACHKLSSCRLLPIVGYILRMLLWITYTVDHPGVCVEGGNNVGMVGTNCRVNIINP